MNEPSGYTALDLIGFTDKGNYSSSANYVKNDLVHYNARVWRCLIDDTSNVTPVAGANWEIWIDEATYLSGLADTTITNPTDGSVLRFDTATSKWINEGVDSTPTQNSNKLVKSGGVYTQLANKANTSSLATVATSGAYSDLIGTPSLATVATSGAYSDLTGKPTIPIVNNGTLTIQKNGTTVQTFTANQSSNVTANITVPTKTSDLTNDSNFVSDSSYSHITVDSAMSSSSTNPVQNKVVNTAISSVSGVAAVKTWMGTCSTAANAQKKEATVDNGFTLTDGVRVGIKFTNSNTFESSTATPITLNVNSTGDINIYYGTTHSGAGNTGKNIIIYGAANRYNYYVYDGTYWVWDGTGLDVDTTYTPQKLGFGYGTCSTAEATAAKTATLASYELVKNGYVSVKFTNAVPASATLNVNSKGAKPIYYHGAAITAGIINAGDMATFVYDGTNYNLVGVDNVTSQIQALANNKQPKTLDTALTIDGTSQTTVEGALGGLNTAVGKREVLVLDTGATTVTSLTNFKFTDSAIDTDMVCIKAELSNPSAQLSDWTVNTNTQGEAAITGSISSTGTKIKLYLMKSSLS